MDKFDWGFHTYFFSVNVILNLTGYVFDICFTYVLQIIIYIWADVSFKVEEWYHVKNNSARK